MSPAHRVPTAVRAVVLALALTLGLLFGAPGRAEAATRAPSALSVASSAQTAVRLTWKPVSKAAGYQVKYATNAGFKKASSLRTTTPMVEISKLRPNKTYYFKVRALRSNGKALTTFSKKLKVKTRGRASFPLLSPTGLAASAINGDELTLSWTAQGAGDRYRVRWSTVASMATPQAKDVSGTSALIDGLSTSTTYFFTVEALSAANLALSQPSAVFRATTAARVVLGTPSGVELTRVNPNDLTVVWDSVPKAQQYQVAYSADSSEEPEYVEGSTTKVTLDGLVADTGYSVKVRALDASGEPAGEFSKAARATTPKADAPLRVASYNVRCHNCTLYNEEQPWRVRRDYVAATINDADPDVVSLQEAQQSRLLDDSSTTQFEDLRTVLNSGLDGAPWTLTNANRYNCVKSTSATNCVYAYQGASNGTRIVYRTDRLVLNSQGSQLLPQLTDGSYERYVVWAFFTQKSTGKKFLFAAIHLEPGNDPSGSDAYAQNRRVQAQAVLAKLNQLNTAGLPIVLAGDASASRADRDGLTGERSNPPYEVFTAGGLVDPLGNVSTAAPVNAPVEVRIHTDYNSVNKFERTARKYSGVNGAYNDYILTTPMRVSEWETVVKLDETGCFVGVIPSDHNLIRATVWLP